MESILEITECPNCGSSDTENDVGRGEHFCRKCGIIIKNNIVLSEQNKKPYKEIFWKKQTDPPGGMTTIGFENQDVFGNQLSQRDITKLNRLRRWQNRYSKFQETRKSSYAIKKIRNTIENMDLPKNVGFLSSDLFFSLNKNQIVDKWGRDCIIYACILLTCRKLKIPITIKQLSRYSGIDRKFIGRAYKKIINYKGDTIPLQNPKDFLELYSRKLKLNIETKDETSKILDIIVKCGEMSGKEPSSIVASAIYLACKKSNQYRTQNEISKATGVSEITIRRRYKEIIPLLKKM